MSAAIIIGRASCSLINLLANLPAKVVLPAPWRPTIIMIVGIFGDFSISDVSDPRISVNSSLTILIICCEASRVSMISWPTARSRTRLINVLTTGRATSASRSAKRISLVTSWTSFSESFPLRLKFLKTPCKRSVKLSKAIYHFLSYFLLWSNLYYQCYWAQ